MKKIQEEIFEWEHLSFKTMLKKSRKREIKKKKKKKGKKERKRRKKNPARE